MDDYRFCWEHADAGGVRLLRAFGASPKVVIPEYIGGLPVAEIGAYCFAEHGPLLRGDVLTEEGGQGARRELCGSYIETLTLPDSVRRTGNYVCYQCTSLHTFTCGSGLLETGSDAFMNCGRLHRIGVRCGSGEPTGLRQMLAQLSSEIEVVFLGREPGGPAAKVLFPEYYESYDEIAPAHLFGRNIEGEGFRARQCFAEGVLDFRQYDRIFPKACAEESERTLCRLALDRLQYPAELSAGAAALYRAYVKEHAAAVCGMAVSERETEQVLFLCENGLADGAVLDGAVRLASSAGWAEGTARFLGWKQRYFARKAARYEFEDF